MPARPIGATMKATQPGLAADSRSSDALCESLRPWCDHAITSMGAERCLFESNFPVEKATCGYRVLWNTFKKIAAPHGEDIAQALLSKTATHLYGLPERHESIT